MSCRVKILVTATCLLVVAGHRLQADEPKDKGDAAAKLVGTWKLVSAKYGGVENDLPTRATTLKHMTSTHYSWATYGMDGQVTRTAGGPYTFNGEVLESIPEYGVGADFEAIKGKRQSYKCKVEGNRWYQSGTLSNGTTLEEVWERVEKK
jgi:hypothetical protein